MNAMRFGRKGQQNWQWIVAVIAAVVIMSMALLIWQAATTGTGFPTTPEEYTDAWGEYGEFAFKPEDQPWRLVSIFFFPLLAYFSLFYFAINLVFARAASHLRSVWPTIQKPLIIFAFSISFMILPFPLTFQLYQVLGGISFLVPITAWSVAIIFIILLIYYVRGHRYYMPPTTPTPPVPTPPRAPGPAPNRIDVLPINIRQSIGNAAVNIRNIAIAINNA
jgi:hypothetical protein